MKFVPKDQLPAALKARAQHPDHAAGVQCDCGCLFVPERIDVVTCPQCETTEGFAPPAPSAA